MDLTSQQKSMVRKWGRTGKSFKTIPRYHEYNLQLALACIFVRGSEDDTTTNNRRYELGTGGRSRVNLELLYQFTAMQRYLQTAGNNEVLADIAKCIRSQFKVPLVQGCLVYSHAASSEYMTPQEDLPRIKAEAWAFCSAALPSLYEADPSVAEAVKSTVGLSFDTRPDWATVKGAFSTKNLNKMGILCEDVGMLGAGGYDAVSYAVAPPYADDELKRCKDDLSLVRANLYADSSKCATVKMPRCGNGVVCSSGNSRYPSFLTLLISAATCILSLHYWTNL
jgi:hypothetical protein